ncbi:MAG: DUF4097 domain-containing protein [Oscillospiraceae bacterium]|jgi:DUF4097 and DUF4098 domain-containing protein YvlB|nr:DUF4097 domain-containing protein [Oscillospiraceae bacterium]
MKRFNLKLITLILTAVFLVSGGITTMLVFAQVVPDFTAGTPGGDKWVEYNESWSLDLDAGGTLIVDLSSVDVSVEIGTSDKIVANFEGYATPDSKGNFPKILASGSASRQKLAESEYNQRNFQLSLGPTYSSGYGLSGTMTVQLPRNKDVRLEVGLFSGNAEIKGGQYTHLAVNTSSGRITVKDIKSSASAEFTSFSGNIDAVDIQAKDCKFDTSSGHVSASNIVVDTLSSKHFSGKLNGKDITVSGGFTVNTSSGNVDLTAFTSNSLSIEGFSSDARLTDGKVSQKVLIDTSSGKVVFDGLTADFLDLKTFSGNITGERVTAQRLRSDTSSGDLDMAMLQAADLDCKTFSGKVDFIMPGDYAFSVDVDTFSGDVDIGYPITMKNTGSESKITGVVGSGGNTVRIESSSGNVSIYPAS